MNLTHVSITQTISAPVETLVNLWLDPTAPGGPWFGAKELILNAAVGGLFFFSVEHEGKVWPHYGRFLQIDKNATIAYTWVSEATKGVESVVTVSFAPKGDLTEITLLHSPLPDDALGQQHKDGWALLLAKLGQQFATQPAASAVAV